MSNTLLPCPFCGGEAKITDGGFSGEQFLVRCRELICPAASGTVRKTQKQAIAAWNRRAHPENKPLSLDELRQMDGEPVYIVESPDWGHWELSYDAEDYMQNRDEDFYGMTCNAVKDGWCSGTCKYGLHNMGWIAYRAKPKEVEHE